MSPNKKNKLSLDREYYNWYGFAKSYLEISRVACQYILDGEKEEQKRFRMFYLLVPIIYNIKHSIEVLLKSLRKAFIEKLTHDFKGHNIKQIFDIFTRETNSKITKIKQYLKKNDIRKDDLLFLENFDNNIDMLKKTIDKYFHCNFIKNEVKNSFIIEDSNNTAFKYPDNDILVKLDYIKIINSTTTDDVEDFKSDIISLIKIMESIHWVLKAYDNI